MQRFNNHSWLEGKHARLGASQHAWLNYDEEKMIRVAHNMAEAARGTKKHDLAKRLIELGEKMPDVPKTLNMYVNDAIGFKMTPEVILVGTDYSFGTADALSFRNGILRIHDLKTGVIPGKFQQLELYGALYCMEYGIKPVEIEFIFAIYQNNEVLAVDGDPLIITNHMSKIRAFSELLAELDLDVLEEV